MLMVRVLGELVVSDTHPHHNTELASKNLDPRYLPRYISWLFIFLMLYIIIEDAAQTLPCRFNIFM